MTQADLEIIKVYDIWRNSIKRFRVQGFSF